MAAPFDWKRTRAGEKHIGLGNLPKDDSISTFRNISQAVPGRDMRLPPALRPLHFDQFPSDPKDPTRRGPGMVAIQRKLVGSDGKSKGKHSVEAATQVPLLDPMVSIDRTAQQDAWHGNKAYRGEIQGTPRAPGRTLHAPISGTLPLSESQQYLMEDGKRDALPEDVHDYDVELDHNGNARVLDEEGQQADLVTYRPFFYDAQGNIVYRDDTAQMEPEEHKELATHPLFGRRTKTQSEHMGRPLPHQITGTGDFVMFPAGPVGEMAEPIPISQGTRFAGNTGVVTPHGMYFPKNIDWTNVQRAEGLAELGAVLIKALGDPGEMFHWDKFLGGEYPKNRKKIEGDPSSGSQDIWSFVDLNPRKVDDFLMEDGKQREVDIPLDLDYELPAYKDIRGDLPTMERKLKPEQFAHYGEPNKMPGKSIMDAPARACVYATRDNPSTACGNCYACDFNYRMNATQTSHWRNLYRMLEFPEQMGSAYQQTLTPQAMLSRESMDDDLVARLLAGGDARGAGAYAMADRILRRNPHVAGWMSTRQTPYLQQFGDSRGWEDGAIADNLNIQVSLPGKMLPEDIREGSTYMVDGNEIDLHALSQWKRADGKPAIGFTGYDKIPKDANTTICPATIPGNPHRCNEVPDPLTGQMKCRNCFRPAARTVYLDNKKPLETAPPSMRESFLEEWWKNNRVA